MANVSRSETGGKNVPSRAHRGPYQLHDQILVAAHRACDLHDLSTAKELLAAAEAAINDHAGLPETRRQRAIDVVVAAYDRLLDLMREGELKAFELGSAPPARPFRDGR